jgi:peptidyl-prolyl cis-trans isomerase C
MLIFSLNMASYSRPKQKEITMAQAAARHILVSTEDTCKALKQQIIDGADFAELAKQNSSCPSGSEGGALGTFGPGQMVKEFDEVVFSAPVGEVQGPVKTQFGFHLVEVTMRND